MYTLVMTMIQAQYDQYVQSLSYFANLFPEPLCERKKQQYIWNKESIGHTVRGKRVIDLTSLSLTYKMSTVC